MTTIAADVASEVRDRVNALDWDALDAQLSDVGHAITPPVLTEDECHELASLFDGGRFRSTIDMARHRFGDGRYRYFDHPLPELIAALRASFYPHLAAVANRWSQRLRGDTRTFPADHEELLERCREAGQTRPTPLILRYGAGDWNALHQDLYGDVFFPFQIVTILSERGAADYEAASSCCSSSDRAPRAGRMCSLRRRAHSSSSRLASAPREGATGITAWECATASRRSPPATAPPWG
jgi:hypothetical protein